MSIVQADLKFYKSETVSDTSSNGGYASEDQAVTGVKNNIWENVSAQQREDGLVTYRKLFAIPRSDSDDDLIDPRLWNHMPTPGDDYVILFAGTVSDTQSTLSESTFYSCGNLKNNVSSGATAITVTVEAAALTSGFHASGRIRLSNQSDPSQSGDYEDVILNSTAPLISGNDVTVYTDTGITNAYLAANTMVSSVYSPGTSSVSTGAIVVTSSSGSVDEATYPPVVNNTGTKDETVTVTFSDATNFSVAGSRSGNLGSGTVSTDFIATNPDNAKELITLLAGFFSGTFAALDTVVIPTNGNNSPFWLKRTVPALSISLTGDENITAYKGES